MSHFVLGADLAAKLGAIAVPVEPIDETGCRIGFYQPSAAPAGNPRSPRSRDELEDRRLRRDGIPLADVLRRLAADR